MRVQAENAELDALLLVLKPVFRGELQARQRTQRRELQMARSAKGSQLGGLSRQAPAGLVRSYSSPCVPYAAGIPRLRGEIISDKSFIQWVKW